MNYVGTAGWAVPRRWAHLASADLKGLARYAGTLNAVEINSSFYRDHLPQTYARWAAQTPRRFRFAVKVPRAITHDARLRGVRAPLENFLLGLRGLGAKLGPLLVQLPGSEAYDPRVASKFFALLRERYDGPVVCEPRHVSWFEPGAERLLVRQRIGRVAADPAPVPTAAQPGGWQGVVYYRLHGSPQKYWSVYEPARILSWARALASLAPRTLAWCVFDNTAGGGGAANALQMATALADQDAT